VETWHSQTQHHAQARNASSARVPIPPVPMD